MTDVMTQMIYCLNVGGVFGDEVEIGAEEEEGTG